MFTRLLKGLADNGHLVEVISQYPLSKSHPNYTDLFQFSIVEDSYVNNLTYDALKYFTVGTSPARVIATYHGNNVCEGLDLPGFQKLLTDHSPKDPPYDVLITQVKKIKK